MDRELAPGIRRTNAIRRWAVGGTLITAALVAVVVLPGRFGASLDRERLEIATVRRGALEAAIEATGQVTPAFERVIAAEASARVTRIVQRAGALVKRGDVIVELDPTVAALALQKLEGDLALKETEERQVRRELDRTLAGLRGQQESKRLDAQLLAHRVSQHRRLRDEGLIADDTYKEVEVAEQKARIELQQLADETDGATKAAEAQIDGLRLAVATLARERDDARRQLELATVRADQDGVLTYVVADEGQAIQRGDVVARIADPERFRVEATVSDVHAAELAAGQPVHVIAGGETLPGRIALVRPKIENGAVSFAVDLGEPRHRGLRNSLRVDVIVVTATRPSALLLAKGPFAQGGRVQQVFVVDGDRAVRRAVTIGLSGWRAFEVLDGLTEGERVIVSDMHDYLGQAEVRIR